MSALTVVSVIPDVLQRLFVEANEAEGRYTVRFYYQHEWKTVTIDDRIPCGKDGLPAFGHNTLKNEIWVCILEKALAKLLGSYEALDGGYLEEGVVMLTGGRPERLYVNNWSQNPGKQPWRKDRLWDKLVQYSTENVLMGTGISSSRGQTTDESKGLVAGHAYAILDVRETSDKKFKLIKLRNPWGQFEWKGPWSDASRNWTFQYRKEMGADTKDDGIFWMEFKDFCTYYDKITCCRLLNDSIFSFPMESKLKANLKNNLTFPYANWNRKRVEGAWDNECAGGMMNNMAFAKNPHFRLTVQKSGRFFLIIYRPYLSQDADAQYYRSGIGFAVYKGTDSNYKILPTDNSPNALLQYPVYARYNSIELDLDQGEYVITPCTMYSNRKGEFRFEVFSPNTFDIQPLEDNLRVGLCSSRGSRPTDDAPKMNSSITIGKNMISTSQQPLARSGKNLNTTPQPTKQPGSNMMTTYQFEFAQRNKF